MERVCPVTALYLPLLYFPLRIIHCFAGTANVNEHRCKAYTDFPKCSSVSKDTLYTEIGFICTTVQCSWKVQSIFTNSFVPKLKSGGASVCVGACARYWTRKSMTIVSVCLTRIVSRFISMLVLICLIH